MIYNGISEDTLYKEYIVKKGDSLYTIAKEFDTTAAQLMDINMLTTNMIYPEQVILVPMKHEAIILENYVTRAGDDIETIAMKFKTTPMAIGEYNDFSKLTLVAGQTLNVPKIFRTYNISNDESIDQILRNTRVSATELLELNKDSWFKPGTTIKI